MNDEKFLLNLRVRFASVSPQRILGNKRCATVAILRRDADGTVQILFVKRSQRPSDPWSGHIALPGGKRDPGDADDRATAVREVLEEVGVDLRDEDRFECLGQLRDVRVHHTYDLVLSCFVYLHKVQGGSIPIVLSPDEIEAVVWFPLLKLESAEKAPVEAKLLRKWIFRANSVWYRVYNSFGVDKVFVPAVRIDDRPGYILWGLTMRCVSMLLNAGGCPRIDLPTFDVRDSILLRYLHERPFHAYVRWVKMAHRSRL